MLGNDARRWTVGFLFVVDSCVLSTVNWKPNDVDFFSFVVVLISRIGFYFYLASLIWRRGARIASKA
jgi:hypothetical protein